MLISKLKQWLYRTKNRNMFILFIFKPIDPFKCYALGLWKNHFIQTYLAVMKLLFVVTTVVCGSSAPPTTLSDTHKPYHTTPQFLNKERNNKKIASFYLHGFGKGFIASNKGRLNITRGTPSYIQQHKLLWPLRLKFNFLRLRLTTGNYN